MKYFILLSILMLFSCDEEQRTVFLTKTTTAVAKVTYPVNTQGTINDQKTFSVKSLIQFLISSSNIGGEVTDVGPISIQSISLELKVNDTNQADNIEVNTSLSRRNCNGTLTTFSTFSRNKTIPLQVPFIGGNIPIAISVQLSPEGVSLLNGTLASNLPWKPSNNYGESTCGDLIFKLNGNASPSGKLASLNLKVVIRYNVEYGECTQNFFLSAITSKEDRCEF